MVHTLVIFPLPTHVQIYLPNNKLWVCSRLVLRRHSMALDPPPPTRDPIPPPQPPTYSIPRQWFNLASYSPHDRVPLSPFPLKTEFRADCLRGCASYERFFLRRVQPGPTREHPPNLGGPPLSDRPFRMLLLPLPSLPLIQYFLSNTPR